MLVFVSLRPMYMDCGARINENNNINGKHNIIKYSNLDVWCNLYTDERAAWLREANRWFRKKKKNNLIIVSLLLLLWATGRPRAEYQTRRFFEESIGLAANRVDDMSSRVILAERRINRVQGDVASRPFARPLVRGGWAFFLLLRNI